MLLARDESAGATSPTRTSVRETSSSATGPATERAGGPNASQANHPGCGRGHTRPERAATRETNQDDSGAAPARRNRDKTIANALEGSLESKAWSGIGLVLGMLDNDRIGTLEQVRGELADDATWSSG